jgi:hypothetical protein
MKKIHFLLLTLLSYSAFAQERQFATFYELGGDSFQSGLGVDMRNYTSNERVSYSFHATFNTGFLWFERYNIQYFSPISAGSSFLFGKTHCLELSLSLRPRMHTVAKNYEHPIGSGSFYNNIYDNVSLDVLPSIGYRVQPRNGRFFGRFYLSPWAFGEKSNAQYGLLNWFPLGTLEHSLAGLSLGFNLNHRNEDDVYTKKRFRHSILLDGMQGLGYDLRVNHTESLDFAGGLTCGINNLSSYNAGDNSDYDWRNISLYGTAIVGKRPAAFEGGVQISHARWVQNLYNASTNESFQAISSELILGFPLGFRLQYPNNGLTARVYALPNVSYTTKVPMSVESHIAVGYTF